MAGDDNKNKGESGSITYDSPYYLHPSNYPKQLHENRTPHESAAFKAFQRRNGPNKEISRGKAVEERNKHRTECNKDGHTREGCFKLIGYPEWWPRKKGEKNKGKAACVKTETDSRNAKEKREKINRSSERRGNEKILKTKDEEITRLNQLNWSLEEKLKSLLVENQIWRELTQTNEAIANNLQQLLAQAQLQQQEQEQTLVNDVESCCGSNYEEDVSTKKCLKCGKKESCVLVLPCRHLCLCNVCESTITICPVCSSTKSAALLINMDT
ncbi:probable BOI-related E3 ubiquitin-protein ligase 3 [Tanacetum coccineum]